MVRHEVLVAADEACEVMNAEFACFVERRGD